MLRQHHFPFVNRKYAFMFCFDSLAVLVLLSAANLMAGLHTWTGGSSGYWSDSANWVGGAPQPGEPAPVELVFPNTAPAFRDLTNDVAGLVVHSMNITAHANSFHGAAGVQFTLHEATVVVAAVSTILEKSFVLQLEGQNVIQSSKDFILRGPIGEAVPGAGLDLVGNLRFETFSTHSGPTRMSGGHIEIYGSMTNTAFLEVATNAFLTLAADFSVLTNNGRIEILGEPMERPDTSRIFGQVFVCGPNAKTTVSMIDYPAFGALVLAGELEAVTDLFLDGLRFTLFETAGAQSAAGRFDALPDGALQHLQSSTVVGRVGYFGGSGDDVIMTLVSPPNERRLLGPWILENGWLQVLGGVGEFEFFTPHRWEANNDLSNAAGWSPLATNLLPVEGSLILTVTNAAAAPRQFYRLAVE